MFEALEIGASGLVAQRVRMDTIAQNVLNAETTKTASGEPYRRRFVVMGAGDPTRADGRGVHIAGIGMDQAPFRKVHDPGNPDADADGFVKYPNVDLAYEMVNMIEASRAYEANITMMETTKAMLTSSMRLLA